MKPHADNTVTFRVTLAGYRAAVERFNVGRLGQDVGATFHSLFEALNWAVALDDQTRARWSPRGEPLGWGWRDEISGGDCVRAIRFARNRAHHQWADALELTTDGFVFPITFPLVFHEWRWRRSVDLPAGSSTDQAAYDKWLAGQPARLSLQQLDETYASVGRPTRTTPYPRRRSSPTHPCGRETRGVTVSLRLRGPSTTSPPTVSWRESRLGRVTPVATKDQQVREVVEGLGLGLVCLGTAGVSSSKLDLEFAFSYAWRRWNHATEYPSIGRSPKPDNVFWIGVTKSERRNTAAVVWRDVGGEYEVGFRWEDWTPPEIADLIGSRPADDWIALATPFRDHLVRND